MEYPTTDLTDINSIIEYTDDRNIISGGVKGGDDVESNGRNSHIENDNRHSTHGEFVGSPSLNFTHSLSYDEKGSISITPGEELHFLSGDDQEYQGKVDGEGKSTNSAHITSANEDSRGITTERAHHTEASLCSKEQIRRRCPMMILDNADDNGEHKLDRDDVETSFSSSTLITSAGEDSRKRSKLRGASHNYCEISRRKYRRRLRNFVLSGKQPENAWNKNEGGIRLPVFDAANQGNSPPVPEPKKVKT